MKKSYIIWGILGAVAIGGGAIYYVTDQNAKKKESIEKIIQAVGGRDGLQKTPPETLRVVLGKLSLADLQKILVFAIAPENSGQIQQVYDSLSNEGKKTVGLYIAG